MVSVIQVKVKTTLCEVEILYFLDVFQDYWEVHSGTVHGCNKFRIFVIEGLLMMDNQLRWYPLLVALYLVVRLKSCYFLLFS